MDISFLSRLRYQNLYRGSRLFNIEDVFVSGMGKQMASPMNFNNPKFIDYAFRKDKSDFFGCVAFANCDLCITTGCGPDMFSDVFRRPILALNFSPTSEFVVVE